MEDFGWFSGKSCGLGVILHPQFFPSFEQTSRYHEDQLIIRRYCLNEKALCPLFLFCALYPPHPYLWLLGALLWQKLSVRIQSERFPAGNHFSDPERRRAESQARRDGCFSLRRGWSVQFWGGVCENCQRCCRILGDSQSGGGGLL